jgi:hypothetical protein
LLEKMDLKDEGLFVGHSSHLSLVHCLPWFRITTLQRSQGIVTIQGTPEQIEIACREVGVPVSCAQ